MESISQDCSDPSPPKRFKLDENSSLIFTSNAKSNTVQLGEQSYTIEIPEETTNTQNLEKIRNISDDNQPLEFGKNASQSETVRLEKEDDNDDDEGDDDNDVVDDDDDDDDDVASTVSNISDLSGISVMSGQDWNCIAGPISWLQKQMKSGADPRAILGHLFGDKFYATRCSLLDKFSLWRLIASVLSEPPPRAKLPHVNTLSDVVHLLKTCSKIVVLTGAGVSVSCGIPDFRSRDGVYARLAVDFPDLPDPQSMFDIDYFRKDPRPFFKFAREIYPGQFKPSPCHRFIKKLEENGKLLRNYTQNIDTLEQVAGIKNVVECHGSFATATCTQCQHKVTCEDIRESVFQQKIPFCPICTTNPDESASPGVMKPDIVFFRESLPKTFHQSMAEDKDECDLLIVIGSSLKVYPVALIPSSLPSHVPQILINRESLSELNFDVELLGDGDVIINQLCLELGGNWTDICWNKTKLTETKPTPTSYQRSGYNSTAEYSEDEGEMSVDWLDRPVPAHAPSSSPSPSLSPTLPLADHEICMEHETSLQHQQLAEETASSSPSNESSRPLALADSNACGDCGKDTVLPQQATIKCRKIRKVKVRNKMTSPLPSTSPETMSAADIKEDRLFSSNDNDGRMSVEQEENGGSDASLVSGRHLSTDSTRDSGIGDGSNSSLSASGSASSSAERHMSVDSHSDLPVTLASRLPENSYFYIRPNRYIFHGAEVMDDASSSSDLDDDADDECQQPLPAAAVVDQLKIKSWHLQQLATAVAPSSLSSTTYDVNKIWQDSAESAPSSSPSSSSMCLPTNSTSLSSSSSSSSNVVNSSTFSASSSSSTLSSINQLSST